MQVAQCKNYIDGLERKLRGNQQHVARLEARLQHELVKGNHVLGTNLDVLPTAQLEQLVHSQEEALKKARAMLVNLAKLAFSYSRFSCGSWRAEQWLC